MVQVSAKHRAFQMALFASGEGMTDTRVVLRLNQQQLELIDKTIARGEAKDRPQLVRRALNEFAVRHGTAAKGKK
jgi:hypothetical protein